VLALSPKAIASAMEKLTVLENAVIGEQTAVIAAARKRRQGWNFAARCTMRWPPTATTLPPSIRGLPAALRARGQSRPR